MKTIDDMLKDVEELLQKENPEQIKERLEKSFKVLKNAFNDTLIKLNKNKKLLDDIVDKGCHGALDTEEKVEKRYKEILSNVKEAQAFLDATKESISYGYFILFLNDLDRFE